MGKILKNISLGQVLLVAHTYLGTRETEIGRTAV
jgi:hypothetical protein